MEVKKLREYLSNARNNPEKIAIEAGNCLFEVDFIYMKDDRLIFKIGQGVDSTNKRKS